MEREKDRVQKERLFPYTFGATKKKKNNFIVGSHSHTHANTHSLSLLQGHTLLSLSKSFSVRFDFLGLLDFGGLLLVVAFLFIRNFDLIFDGVELDAELLLEVSKGLVDFDGVLGIFEDIDSVLEFSHGGQKLLVFVVLVHKSLAQLLNLVQELAEAFDLMILSLDDVIQGSVLVGEGDQLLLGFFEPFLHLLIFDQFILEIFDLSILLLGFLSELVSFLLKSVLVLFELLDLVVKFGHQVVGFEEILQLLGQGSDGFFLVIVLLEKLVIGFGELGNFAVELLNQGRGVFHLFELFLEVLDFVSELLVVLSSIVKLLGLVVVVFLEFLVFSDEFISAFIRVLLDLFKDLTEVILLLVDLLEFVVQLVVGVEELFSLVMNISHLILDGIIFVDEFIDLLFKLGDSLVVIVDLLLGIFELFLFGLLGLLLLAFLLLLLTFFLVFGVHRLLVSINFGLLLSFRVELLLEFFILLVEFINLVSKGNKFFSHGSKTVFLLVHTSLLLMFFLGIVGGIFVLIFSVFGSLFITLSLSATLFLSFLLKILLRLGLKILLRAGLGAWLRFRLTLSITALLLTGGRGVLGILEGFKFLFLLIDSEILLSQKVFHLVHLITHIVEGSLVFTKGSFEGVNLVAVIEIGRDFV
mmetsp:Transcript_26259/g.23132  ORF Transcript_26259/g.23132 Transcript_26259/m.23132 type:complete len:640 (-) Transcript_26259:511-2430(-)